MIGSFPLGESDRVVTFFARDFGRLRGVAKAARRLKSRFGGSLELFPSASWCSSPPGGSRLVDRPLRRHASVRPCGRTSGGWGGGLGVSRGPHDRRALTGNPFLRPAGARQSDEETTRPPRVPACFGVRCLDLLGHRPQLDRCRCGRACPFRDRLGGGVCSRAAGDRAWSAQVSPRHWRPSTPDVRWRSRGLDRPGRTRTAGGARHPAGPRHRSARSSLFCGDEAARGISGERA
jgi:hypothetical protein